jgi:hypothetical protein
MLKMKFIASVLAIGVGSTAASAQDSKWFSNEQFSVTQVSVWYSSKPEISIVKGNAVFDRLNKCKLHLVTAYTEVVVTVCNKSEIEYVGYQSDGYFNRFYLRQERENVYRGRSLDSNGLNTSVLLTLEKQ